MVAPPAADPSIPRPPARQLLGRAETARLFATRSFAEMTVQTYPLVDGVPPVFVFDNVFCAPDRLRTFALESAFLAERDPLYPGFLSRLTFELGDVVRALGPALPADCDPAAFVPAEFARLGARPRQRLASLEVPHIDFHSAYGLVAYLNAPADCRGGTGFYRHERLDVAHVPTRPDAHVRAIMSAAGARSFDDFYQLLTAKQVLSMADIVRRMVAQTVDDDADPIATLARNWVPLLEVPMRFNRLLIYSSRLFHRPFFAGPDFGQGAAAARLTLRSFAAARDQAAHRVEWEAAGPG